MTATEFKATVLAVLDDVADGDEVEVTKHGRPVARVVPIRSPAGLRGRFAGVARTTASDEELFGTGEAWETS
jgi:prevent-host-death family protein